MTVDELLRRMSSAEISEWQAFYKIDPWDNYRDDWRFAMLASTMVNMWSSKGSRTYQIKDFLPTFRQRKQHWTEIMKTAKQWVKLTSPPKGK